jgi:hypothetical protein
MDDANHEKRSVGHDVIGTKRPQHFSNQGNEGHTEQNAPDVGKATDRDHQKQFDREADVERTRAEIADVMGIKSTAERAAQPAQHHHLALDRLNVVADRAGDALALGNCPHRKPRRRRDQVLGADDDQDSHDPNRRQEGEVALQRMAEQGKRLNAGEPVRSAGQVPQFDESDLHDDAECERRHGEIVPLETKHQPADGPGKRSDDCRRKQHIQPGPNAKPSPDQSRAIGAKPVECSVSQ